MKTAMKTGVLRASVFLLQKRTLPNVKVLRNGYQGDITLTMLHI